MSKTTENDMNISPAFLAAAKLRAEKGGDYGSIADYFPHGDMSYTTMLHIKTKRLVNLADKKRMGIEPNFESIKQNVLDLINYASYYYEYLEEVLDE